MSDDDRTRETLREVERQREEDRLRRLREAEAERRRRDEDALKSMLCKHGRIRGDCPEC